MSKIIGDVKSGLKGVRGAGDAVRGGLMEAADEAFDNPNHPSSRANREKHHAVAEKGKRDISNADEMIARNEWKRKGVDPGAPGAEGAAYGQHSTGSAGTYSSGPVHHETATEGLHNESTGYGQHRAEPAPATATAGYGTGVRNEPVGVPNSGPNVHHPQQQYAPQQGLQGREVTGQETGDYHQPAISQGGSHVGPHQEQYTAQTGVHGGRQAEYGNVGHHEPPLEQIRGGNYPQGD